MPVELSKGAYRPNPELVKGEVYKVVSGYGAGRVFAVANKGTGAFAQYLTDSDGWDPLDSFDDSVVVCITLQEV